MPMPLFSATTRRLSLLLVSMSLVLSGCNLGLTTFQSTRNISQSAAIPAGSQVTVSTRNGRIEVIFDDTLSDIQIDAVFRSGAATQLAADERVAAAQLDITLELDRTVTIKPAFPGGHRNKDSASLVVRMPTIAQLSIDTKNGRVEVTGGGGTLDARTSNGAMTIVGFEGEIQATTSNGKITATEVSSPITLHTSNGRIKLDLAADAVGPFQLKTSNGRVNVTLDANYSGTINMKTSNGRVSVLDNGGRIQSQDIKKNKGTVTFGTGSETASTIETSNGSIQVTTRVSRISSSADADKSSAD